MRFLTFYLPCFHFFLLSCWADLKPTVCHLGKSQQPGALGGSKTRLELLKSHFLRESSLFNPSGCFLKDPTHKAGYWSLCKQPFAVGDIAQCKEPFAIGDIHWKQSNRWTLWLFEAEDNSWTNNELNEELKKEMLGTEAPRGASESSATLLGV